jgi:hypothetical protein
MANTLKGGEQEERRQKAFIEEIERSTLSSVRREASSIPPCFCTGSSFPATYSPRRSRSAEWLVGSPTALSNKGKTD